MESADLLDECPEVTRVALSSASAHRDIWLAAFALDGRVGRMVLGASEPMLGQMRVAWWRDQLGKLVHDRPRGDHLLDLIGTNWNRNEAALVDLIDGWEALLSPRPLAETAILEFVAGRVNLSQSLANLVGTMDHERDVRRAGTLWALADLAINARDEAELSRAVKLGAAEGTNGLRLSRDMRPLAVIAGLAQRSLHFGGRPMLGDRASPLIALRLSLIGR